MCVPIFFAKNLALGENFLSPTLNIIQPFIKFMLAKANI